MAAALVCDDHHHACVELFTGLQLASRPLLVPGTVVAEVGYLRAREAGARVEALFLTALADGDFQLVDLIAADYRGLRARRDLRGPPAWGPPTRRSSPSPSDLA
ncbi:hypothetical protein GCM10009609_43570 [Pseudonocardia aurantiaca]|uniref:PIN domain-containing protein n=1 Tax=Pseudonocardia aurantiaca TaxID=75290 RepID=A0ABW4FY26_9PSEU